MSPETQILFQASLHFLIHTEICEKEISFTHHSIIVLHCKKKKNKINFRKIICNVHLKIGKWHLNLYCKDLLLIYIYIYTCKIIYAQWCWIEKFNVFFLLFVLFVICVFQRKFSKILKSAIIQDLKHALLMPLKTIRSYLSPNGLWCC